jgi:hypothetical protein
MDKAEVGRRQLGTALHLFLTDLDPVSVHCLACGGAEVAGWLARDASRENFETHAETTAGLKPSELRAIRNRHWNAFKHATTRQGKPRDDGLLLAEFRPDANEDFLFIGWYDFSQAGLPTPVEAQVFLTWYYAKHPDRLSPDVDFSPMQRLFPDLVRLGREDQRAHLIAVCREARNFDPLMSAHLTDPRPLILP